MGHTQIILPQTEGMRDSACLVPRLISNLGIRCANSDMCLPFAEKQLVCPCKAWKTCSFAVLPFIVHPAAIKIAGVNTYWEAWSKMVVP